MLDYIDYIDYTSKKRIDFNTYDKHQYHDFLLKFQSMNYNQQKIFIIMILDEIKDSEFFEKDGNWVKFINEEFIKNILNDIYTEEKNKDKENVI